MKPYQIAGNARIRARMWRGIARGLRLDALDYQRVGDTDEARDRVRRAECYERGAARLDRLATRHETSDAGDGRFCGVAR